MVTPHRAQVVGPASSISPAEMFKRRRRMAIAQRRWTISMATRAYWADRWAWSVEEYVRETTLTT
jgi:hypothetical protein